MDDEVHGKQEMNIITRKMFLEEAGLYMHQLISFHFVQQSGSLGLGPS